MAVRNKASPASVALVSATMSKAVKKVVQTALPGVVQLQTSSTHKAVAGSRHEFTSVPPGRDRLDMLRDIIEPEVRRWHAPTGMHLLACTYWHAPTGMHLLACTYWPCSGMQECAAA
jgi:hypothetical protein